LGTAPGWQRYNAGWTVERLKLGLDLILSFMTLSVNRVSTKKPWAVVHSWLDVPSYYNISEYDVELDPVFKR